MMDWWTVEIASAYSRNAAQALGLFAVAGFVAGLLQMRDAVRPDLLAAWIVLAAGTALAQLPVQLAGMTGWGVEMVSLSGTARTIQCLGVILFVRGVFRDKCGGWPWAIVTAVVLGFMVVL